MPIDWPTQPSQGKLQHRSGDAWIEHSHPPVYQLDTMDNGGQRLRSGVPGGDPVVFGKLSACLEPPLFLLYVLHTPRGEGEPGRYQSTEIDHAALNAFLTRFEAYLANDARFDLWAYSPAARATVVWDRHNTIFAYGNGACFEATLRALGFTAGELPLLGEHMHHYRAEYDADARAILEAFDWHRTDLRPQDEQ